MIAPLRLALFAAMINGAAGHGQLNFPPSTRQGLPGKTWPGALSGQGAGGYCEQPHSENPNNALNGACMLFSQPSVKQPGISMIPVGGATLNDAKYRTNNINCSLAAGCTNDWTVRHPWRSPGVSPVLGSGCGVAGGGIVRNANGGWPATGMTQGQDPLDVLAPPAGGPTTRWARNSTQDVAMGIWANHGGGYAYRLCKNVAGQVSEECFQRTHLRFADEKTQWLQHINGTKYEIPAVKFTTAAGHEWMKVPIPTCAAGGKPDGHGFTDGVAVDGRKHYTCGPNGTEYPEPELNGQRIGLFGFGYCNHTDTTHSCNADKYHDFSIVDQVLVPGDLETGHYLLSWRWDCEQTTQIWQNCADVLVV